MVVPARPWRGCAKLSKHPIAGRTSRDGRFGPPAVHRRARCARQRDQKGSLDPGGGPVRQPVARYRLGEIRHRPRAGDHRRETAQAPRSVPLRRRRQRARPALHAHRAPRSHRRIAAQLVPALLPRQGAAALHARRDDRAAAGAAAGARRAGHADRAAPRRHRRRPGAVQGAQVDDHARRPRVHLAVDPLCGHGIGACRADCRAQDDRSRSAASGAGAQPGILSYRLRGPAQRCRRHPRPSVPRSMPRTAT